MKVIYEDNHLIIINKNPGELSQSDKTRDLSLVDKTKEYLKAKYQKKGNVYLGLVNRLDRPTSGLIIFSKTSKCLARMNKLQKLRKIKKTYLVITENPPHDKSGQLTNYLKKNQTKNKSFVTNRNDPKSKKAVLYYKLLKTLKNYFLLEVQLETGRHHQIRCQLSHIKCFIKGDLKYGAKRSNRDKSICLHSYKIEFKHPVSNKELSIIAEPPKNNIW